MCCHDAFLADVSNRYREMFGLNGPQYDQVFSSIAIPVLAKIEQGGALYHTVEHTENAIKIAHNILLGKQKYEGYNAVSPYDWLQLILATLCCNIGYGRDKNNPEYDRFWQTLQHGHLQPYSIGSAAQNCPIEHSKAYVATHFAANRFVNISLVQNSIEMTRFPVPSFARYQSPLSDGGLCRAANLLSGFGDVHFLQKLPYLFQELEGTGANLVLGYENFEALKANYSDFYACHIHPYIGPSINYLGVVPEGPKLISRLYTNILAT